MCVHFNGWDWSILLKKPHTCIFSDIEAWWNAGSPFVGTWSPSRRVVVGVQWGEKKETHLELMAAGAMGPQRRDERAGLLKHAFIKETFINHLWLIQTMLNLTCNSFAEQQPDWCQTFTGKPHHSLKGALWHLLLSGIKIMDEYGRVAIWMLLFILIQSWPSVFWQ